MAHIPHPQRSIALIGLLGILLLVLTACGPHTSSTTGSGSGKTTPTPTPTGGYGNIHGCPSSTVVSTPPQQANVIIQRTDVNTTITAHVGDVIEIRLSFGEKWSGPESIPSNLQQQQPAGYTSTSDNACIWRFVALSAGAARLDFYMQALCPNGMLCPMFIADLPFTIDIQ
jgi:hypothetical protein